MHTVCWYGLSQSEVHSTTYCFMCINASFNNFGFCLCAVCTCASCVCVWVGVSGWVGEWVGVDLSLSV